MGICKRINNLKIINKKEKGDKTFLIEYEPANYRYSSLPKKVYAKNKEDALKVFKDKNPKTKNHKILRC